MAMATPSAASSAGRKRKSESMTPAAVAGAASLAGLGSMAATNDPEMQKLMLQIKLKSVFSSSHMSL
jgi:hypothetical protein